MTYVLVIKWSKQFSVVLLEILWVRITLVGLLKTLAILSTFVDTVKSQDKSFSRTQIYLVPKIFHCRRWPTLTLSFKIFWNQEKVCLLSLHLNQNIISCVIIHH